MVKSFTIYEEYYDLITLLSDREQANVLLAIAKYMFEDNEIKLNEREKKVFVNLKRPLDKSKNKSKNTISRQNQKEIKNKSNENQKEIKSKSKGVTHQDVNVNDNVYVNNIYSFIEDNFGRTLSPIEYEMIQSWEDNELTRYAIKEAVLNGKYNLRYIEAILNNFRKNNITSVQQAQDQSKRFKSGNVPDWFDKEITKETDEESSKELEKMLKEFE